MLRKRTLLKQSSPYPIILHFDGDLTNNGSGGTMINVSGEFNTSVKKFGTAALYNPTFGEGVRLPNSIASYLNSDFTIDFWVKPDNTLPANGVSNIFQLGATNNGYYDSYIPLYFVRSADYQNVYKIAPFSTTYRTLYDWTHVALVRYQNIIKIYSNGSLIGETSEITGTSSPSQTISALLPGSNSILDEFRFSNYAVWTANFTPPTAPYA